MPRYVILEHDWPQLHWDLLLECGPVLQAWRLLREPSPDAAVPAERNVDHRLVYLDYEGPVSGGRGTVRQWDAGEYVRRVDHLPELLVVELHGRRGTLQCRLRQGPSQDIYLAEFTVHSPPPEPGASPRPPCGPPR